MKFVNIICFFGVGTFFYTITALCSVCTAVMSEEVETSQSFYQYVVLIPGVSVCWHYQKNSGESLCQGALSSCRSGVSCYQSVVFWCRIHLWFRLMGGLQAKSMTSQRYRATYKMADMRYNGNVMTTTRWRLYVILHLQQYSRRLNLFVFCHMQVYTGFATFFLVTYLKYVTYTIHPILFGW